MPDFLRVDGRLHHVKFRSGSCSRAIVFANSLGTDLRIWDSVIDRLPPEIPVMTYDKSGHGLSEGGAARIQNFADDLAGLMDRFELRDALVCGVSVGGMIALSLAVTRPELVAGLVLCNTGHRIGTKDTWNQRIAAVRSHGLEAISGNVLERWFSPGFRKSSPDAVAGYGMMLSRTEATGYVAACAAIRDADLTEMAKSIACPTLCIAGSEDLATPPDLVKSMADLIPAANYICFDGVGHLPCIETPQKLAEHLSDQYGALS